MAKSPYAYIHGELVKQVGNDESHSAYVACLKNVETGDSVIKVVDNPMVDVWVAKPQCRQNTVKRESAPKEELDRYRCLYTRKAETLWNAINNPGRFRPCHGFVNERKQLSSPYVYGADIDYGVHLKIACKRANGERAPNEYKVGFLDIETDVVGVGSTAKSVILITFINWDGQTYVGILREFFGAHSIDEVIAKWGGKYDKDGKPVHHTEEELKAYTEYISKFKDEGYDKNKHRISTKASHELILPSLHSRLSGRGKKAFEEANPLDIHYQIFDDEVALIKWIFDRIHHHKPDFCTIWNMDYDIPYILDRLAFRGVDPCDICCHPDIDKKYRVCSYHLDKGKEDDHITDHWSWWHLSDYTRYVDAMCCYGRLRKAKAREPSYKLGAIGGKEIGVGKLEFGDGADHTEMQRFHPVEYTVYNIIDVMIMYVMEHKNTDILNMCMLIGNSTLDEFAHQSVQLKNSYYEYLDGLGRVPASIGEPIRDPWDKYIENKGGAVLSPDNAIAIAVAALWEDPDFVMQASRFVCDIDVSSMYPSLLQMLNCSKETKLATILSIDNTKRRGVIDVETVIPDKTKMPPDAAAKLKIIPVEDFCIEAIYTESNAIVVGQMFGLPSLEEVDRIIEQQHPELVNVIQV